MAWFEGSDKPYSENPRGSKGPGADQTRRAAYEQLVPL
jgi:hypothetical protein